MHVTPRRSALGLLTAAVALAAAASLVGAGAASADDEPAAPLDGEMPGVTWGVAPVADEVGRQRPNFVYSLDPGQTLADAIVVLNHGERPLTLAVYASDALTTQAGVLDLLPEGGTPVDLGAWIHVDTPSIVVPAKGSVEVPFTVFVPANATPGDHSAGIVTSLAAAGSQDVRVVHRLGSRVYARVSGELDPVLTVSDLRVQYLATADPAAPGDLRLTYTVRNDGNVRLAAHSSVHVAGLWGIAGRDVAVEDLPEILPGNQIPVTTTLEGVWPLVRTTAELTLEPFVAPGADAVAVPPTAAKVALWTVPWPQLAVLVLLAGLVWLVVRERRRRRRRLEATIDAAVAAAVDAVRAEQSQATEPVAAQADAP